MMRSTFYTFHLLAALGAARAAYDGTDVLQAIRTPEGFRARWVTQEEDQRDRAQVEANIRRVLDAQAHGMSTEGMEVRPVQVKGTVDV
jgi:hypothetical protein